MWISLHILYFSPLSNSHINVQQSPAVNLLVSGQLLQLARKSHHHYCKGKHRHRRNVTSHHFTSLLFTSFHFYVHSNFFGSYQLKGKYNTHTHIQQLNISLHFSSLLTLTSIINWKAKTIHIHKAIQKVQSSLSQVVPLILVLNLTTRWYHLY